MSQDNIRCIKCNTLCGYDDGAVRWQGFNLCRYCKRNLMLRLCAFLGLDGLSSDDSGVTIEWQDIDKILSHIKRDYDMRVSYITTDKELYERVKVYPCPIEKDE